MKGGSALLCPQDCPVNKAPWEELLPLCARLAPSGPQKLDPFHATFDFRVK